MIRRRMTVAIALAIPLFSTACADAHPTSAATLAPAPAADVVRLAGASMGPPKFNVITRVVRVMSSRGGSTTTTPVAGARVKLTLLPLLKGDRVTPNAARYLSPDSIGTVVTDSSGQVGFYNIDVTRFRLEVLPPDGAPLPATTQEYGPPIGGTLHYSLSLRKR